MYSFYCRMYCCSSFLVFLKHTYFFTRAGAGAGQKKTRSRSRSKMDRLRNTGSDCSFWSGSSKSKTLSKPSFRSHKFINGRIRTFKTRIRIGEKTRIRPNPDSKHCVNLSRFSSLDKQEKGYLTREDFLRIPELAINPLGDRIVHSFFSESNVCILLYDCIILL